MGSGVSRRYKYGINTERYFKNKILPRSRELLKILSFSYRRSLYLFRLFIKIDKDKSGQISLNEFRRFFGIRKGAFLERLFCILDSDQNGTLEFNEFVVGIWNFCTNDMHLLAKFAFDIFDIDRNEELSIEEIDALVRMVHNTSHADESTMRGIREFCPNDRITLGKFIQLASEQPDVLKPIIDAQQLVQGQVFSVNFWRRRTDKRRRKFGRTEIPIGMSWESLMELFASYEGNKSDAKDNDDSMMNEEKTNSAKKLGSEENKVDLRLKEERREEKLKIKLNQIEAELEKNYIIDEIHLRKEFRLKLWKILWAIEKAHVDTLNAKMSQEIGTAIEKLIVDDNSSEESYLSECSDIDADEDSATDKEDSDDDIQNTKKLNSAGSKSKKGGSLRGELPSFSYWPGNGTCMMHSDTNQPCPVAGEELVIEKVRKSTSPTTRYFMYTLFLDWG
uniref:EF-hand domain-containing protein n=2 Tax=Ditylum brightwellii TaxID=49249 RepID=A0A7S4QMY1_9STRA|mmetsp:Transcript_46715/g.70542  ORF Transcript_46715/g.70542 Transcript_46715/m.70542 type:complete len:449 (+) Transcript_46715:267-1613(+)